ncbi:hypothetical protein NDU88_002160 [Pleurodeles waltl]|uniref:Uncharacterized protein n=1 Tax=Pleurodeles waltl TaxID=8319 RepID=A0AAV7L0H3_PLEWA|nr:hypothetical protein NDU88_002160 [Pleurodeles waltl]
METAREIVSLLVKEIEEVEEKLKQTTALEEAKTKLGEVSYWWVPVVIEGNDGTDHSLLLKWCLCTEWFLPRLPPGPGSIVRPTPGLAYAGERAGWDPFHPAVYWACVPSNYQHYRHEVKGGEMHASLPGAATLTTL